MTGIFLVKTLLPLLVFGLVLFALGWGFRKSGVGDQLVSDKLALVFYGLAIPPLLVGVVASASFQLVPAEGAEPELETHHVTNYSTTQKGILFPHDEYHIYWDGGEVEDRCIEVFHDGEMEVEISETKAVPAVFWGALKLPAYQDNVNPIVDVKLHVD